MQLQVYGCDRPCNKVEYLLRVTSVVDPSHPYVRSCRQLCLTHNRVASCIMGRPSRLAGSVIGSFSIALAHLSSCMYEIVL